MSTVEKKEGASAPKKKTARVNQRAILETPEKSGEPPVKKNVGRKSLLAPIVEQLKNNPGDWFIIAKGKKGTVSQTRSRLVALCPEIVAECHVDEDNPETAKCYARYVTPE